MIIVIVLEALNIRIKCSCAHFRCLLFTKLKCSPARSSRYILKPFGDGNTWFMNFFEPPMVDCCDSGMNSDWNLFPLKKLGKLFLKCPLKRFMDIMYP